MGEAGLLASILVFGGQQQRQCGSGAPASTGPAASVFTRAAIVTQGEGRCCCTLSVHAGNGSVAGMGRVCLCQQQLHCGVHMYTRASRKEKVRSAYMHACLQSDVGVGRW